MSPHRALLRFEDKLAGERALLLHLRRREDRALASAGILAALLLHLSLYLLPFPVRANPPSAEVRRADFPTVARWLPEPDRAPVPTPAPSGPAYPPAPIARMSLPASPPLPEPIPEPPPVTARTPIRVRDPEAFFGPPEPPPPVPLESEPETPRPVVEVPPRIDEDYPQAVVFPPAARALRVDATAIVEVGVLPDGTAGEVQVLRVTRPGMGFEDAARRAVKTWRFVPGTRDGVAVPSTLVVKVDFKW